jgi:hypothetical protein
MEEFKKFLPALGSVTKSHHPNTDLELLRKVKQTDYLPSEEDLKALKNDTVLEYLGEILFQRDKRDLAVSTVSRMRSDKVFSILLRRDRNREAVELAFSRKNREAIM